MFQKNKKNQKSWKTPKIRLRICMSEIEKKALQVQQWMTSILCPVYKNDFKHIGNG